MPDPAWKSQRSGCLRERTTFQARVEQRAPLKEAERVARWAVRRPGPRGSRRWQKPGWKGEHGRGKAESNVTEGL